MEQNIDLSINRRLYFSHDCEVKICPECNSDLAKYNCTVLLEIKSDADEGEFMTNLTGSRFCNNCPVVVFDEEKIAQAARLGIEKGKNLQYLIAGIVDLNSIPEAKQHLEIGIDDNPVPLVQFLPALQVSVVAQDKKVGRNKPCFCGSGKKFKKCCGNKIVEVKI